MKLLGVIAILSLLGASCGADRNESDTVVVFAAASLTDAFAEIAAAFEVVHPDIAVQLNLAGSSTLREQILQGALADVFASADDANMERLTAAGDAEMPFTFATNTLQIAIPSDNPGGLVGLMDFDDDGLLIGLCSAGVPCGDLARQILLDAGVVAAVDTNEPDVRALLTKIAVGELDAGIVYRTDVLSAGDAVRGIDLPADPSAVARYPIARLVEAPNPTDATAFIDFVLSTQGQAILNRYGFAAP